MGEGEQNMAQFKDLIITSKNDTRYISLATFNSIKDNTHRFGDRWYAVVIGGIYYSLYDNGKYYSIHDDAPFISKELYEMLQEEHRLNKEYIKNEKEFLNDEEKNYLKGKGNAYATLINKARHQLNNLGILKGE